MTDFVGYNIFRMTISFSTIFLENELAVTDVTHSEAVVVYLRGLGGLTSPNLDFFFFKFCLFMYKIVMILYYMLFSDFTELIQNKTTLL